VASKCDKVSAVTTTHSENNSAAVGVAVTFEELRNCNDEDDDPTSTISSHFPPQLERERCDHGSVTSDVAALQCALLTAEKNAMRAEHTVSALLAAAALDVSTCIAVECDGEKTARARIFANGNYDSFCSAPRGRPVPPLLQCQSRIPRYGLEELLLPLG
jgi:hypothetical protein